MESLHVTYDDYDMDFEHTSRRLFVDEEEIEERDYENAADSYSEASREDDENEVTEHVISPTSVTNALTHIVSTKSTTIVMGEEGAEVALFDLTNLPGSKTPSRNTKHLQESPLDAIRAVRTNSLLDVERTPLRASPHSQSTSALTPNTCACFGGCDEMGPEFLERTIQTFLEEPAPETSSGLHQTYSCTDWQAWSYFGFGGTPNKQRGLSPGQSPSKENIRSNLRHRASQSVRARKTAVRQLSKDLAPFANSPARSPARAPSLFRNRSFSVSDHRSAISRVSNEKGATAKVIQRSSFADVLHLCTMPENTTLESPDLLFRINPNSSLLADESICYDSDPEDFTRRRQSHKTDFLADDLSDSENLKQWRALPGISASPSKAMMDVHNDTAFAIIVQEVFNRTTTLVLHPRTTEGQHNARPLAINAWLERGQNLSHGLIQPKWMWKPKPRVTGAAALKLLNPSLRSVELLDVTRILKMEDLADRKLHPFAKPARCFIIKTIHGDEFCFEAPNESERDHLVYSLKLVIARFGAKVLVGDPRVYYEFFSMMDAGVPGNAPDLYGTMLFDQEEDEEEEEDELCLIDSSDASTST
jgi:hypothetical protein